MAWVGLGVFYGAVITGIPVVTGVAEGVHHQKEQNKEAANETRMVKFYLDVFCEAPSKRKDEVNGTIVVLRHDKLYCAPKDPETLAPKPLATGDPPPHPFTGFYIQYPDDDRFPPERGLVSTISLDPPMLNWIYADKPSQALRYGNRTASIQHVVGPWDWTEDESGVTLEGWEGFVAVEVEREDPAWAEGLRWQLFFDRGDDGLRKGALVPGREVLQCSLERRVLPEDLVRQQQEDADKKMQVKSTGDLKTKWG